MAGTVGFSGGIDVNGTNQVSIGTDPTGAVTVTVTPTKPDGTPDSSQPPTVVKGNGEMPNPAPAPGSKTGTFRLKVGDPLWAVIELKDTCEVVISFYSNIGVGEPVYVLSFPQGQPDWKKQTLVALLRQAAIDAAPKAPAPPAKQAGLKVQPVKPLPGAPVLQPGG